MSDKFFFKGRQDARQSHIKYGYEQKVSHKSGSKKYPLELVVTSEQRRQEVEVIAADANLHSVVTLDTSEGAVESIETLTAILNKNPTVKVEQTPSRNEPCTCGSGKKYKKCCG
jgi:SWIM/SEC-C metal-binding protein